MPTIDLEDSDIPYNYDYNTNIFEAANYTLTLKNVVWNKIAQGAIALEDNGTIYNSPFPLNNPYNNNNINYRFKSVNVDLTNINFKFNTSQLNPGIYELLIYKTDAEVYLCQKFLKVNSATYNMGGDFLVYNGINQVTVTLSSNEFTIVFTNFNLIDETLTFGGWGTNHTNFGIAVNNQVSNFFSNFKYKIIKR